jgi:hypothetical protein
MQPTHNPATTAEHPSTGPADPIVATVDVASILRCAARYLDRHGWCQGAYFDQTAVCFTPAACLVGAVGMVCYGGPVEAPAQMFGTPEFDDFEATITHLDEFLLFEHGTPSAYEFNDADGRTAEQVITALRAAADDWEDRHDPAGSEQDDPVQWLPSNGMGMTQAEIDQILVGCDACGVTPGGAA